MKKNKLNLLLLFVLLILVISRSYAWFADRSNPSLEATDIEVMAAEGLLIKLTPDSLARLNVNLNQMLLDKEEFILKQVSSADGENFYTIDFKEGASQGNVQYIQVGNINTTEKEAYDQGYINYDFYLQTENYDKYVYFHKDSFISGPAEKALRIGLTIYNDNEPLKIIVGNEEENGINHPFTTEAVVKSGSFLFSDKDKTLVSDQIVYTFQSKDAGRAENDTDEIDESKVLLLMPKNSQYKVNVKIWLEGGDKDCDNSLASTTLDFKLKFGSANVLLNAPNVIADNNLMIIQNLTKDMEYSLDNGNNWQDVTNILQTFEKGSSVLVRIKEIVNISPNSKTTKVIFDE